MSEYTFKMKKGDLELELKSNDLKFVETQLMQWQQALLSPGNSGAKTPESAEA